MRYLLGLVCVFALGAMDCSETVGSPGSGGDGGSAGIGGDEGRGGEGGGGERGCPAAICPDVPETCESASAEPVEPCCELPPPPTQVNACGGIESTENPSSCGRTGVATVYRLTSLELAADCNVGFNLDACNGQFCAAPRFPSEGIDGVDNAFAVIDGQGRLSQLFADALCGSTRGEGAQCDQSIPVLDIQIAFESNLDERCANVVIWVDGRESGRAILHLGEATPEGTRCASGALGPIPLTLGEAEVGLQGWAVRMTVSDNGFSDGMLGAILDRDSAAELLETALPGLGPNVADYLDTFVGHWCGGARECNALSGTYEIGGVAE